MASSWQFPRWRRVLMQGVLWLIFLATLGLAALVNHQVRKALVVPLGESIELDPIGLRLPAGWEVNGVSDLDSRGVRALEPAHFGRRLEVILHRVIEPMSAQEIISRFQAEIFSHLRDDSSIVIAGQPGALFAGTIDLPVPGGMLRQKHLVAAAMLPEGFAVTLHLVGHNDIDPTDIALINDFAASITIAQPAPVEAQMSALDLSYGIQIKIPQGATLFRQNDKLVTERQLLFDENRASVRLTSLMFSSNAAEDAVRGVLAVRAPAWVSAAVTSVEPGQWRIARKGDVRAIAFLQTGPGHRAVLALIHAHDTAQANDLWNKLRSGLSFTGNFDFAPLLSAGQAQATRLAQQGLDELVSESTSNEWWQWTRSRPGAILGWTRVQYDPASPRHLLRESRWFSSGHVMQFVEEAETSVDLRQYACRMQRSRSDVNEEGGFDPVVSAETQLRGGELTMITSSQSAQGRFEGPAQPQFIPGAWLPLLMGRADAAPMVLITDTLAGMEGQPVLHPLVLVIEPTTEHPRTLAGENEPMPCLRLTLNGSGRASRWYFNARGELEMIDLPDGISRVRCPESKIRFDFAKDPRMLPPGRTF